MKNRKNILLLAGCGLLLLSGCGSDGLKQAQQDLEQESYEYALQGYKAVIEEGEDLAQAYRGAGISSLKLGNYEDAVNYFTEALSQEKTGDSFQKDVLSYKITAEYKLGQYDQALADCQSLANYSMDADSYFLTGKVLLAADAYEEAGTNFENAYQEDHSSEMAIGIYEAYKEKDMEADGAEYLEKALEKEGDSKEGRYNKGKIYYYMEDYENARKQLEAAAEEGVADSYCLLGQIYLDKKDTENARAMYQKYLDAEGTAAKGYNGLALCDMEDGDYESALKNIENGLADAETEDMKLLMYNEIVAYEKLQDFQTAKEKADKYLSWFPDDEAMQKEQIFLASRVGGN